MEGKCGTSIQSSPHFCFREAIALMVRRTTQIRREAHREPQETVLFTTIRLGKKSKNVSSNVT